MELQHEQGEIIAQRYRIIDTLGQGGSGTTYQAEDLQTHQQVALKALSLHRMTDWKMMELFEREARVLAQLNYPNIPKYLDYFQVDTPENCSFYISQQLAQGQSLAVLVENGWRANESVVQQIAVQILEILIYLHELEPPVIHRDLKPQNIIRSPDGQVFLVDFGAVQDTYHSTFMRGSTVVGTYGYMAPEQFRGQAVPTTDLYGLGATLLFLLTHRSPAELPTDRLKLDFRSRVQISEKFADWLEKMLEPDTEERFSSAKEALKALRNKREIRSKSNLSIPWKGLVGVGVVGVATITILNSYKYAVFDSLGLTAYVKAQIESGNIELKNYLSKGGNPNLKDATGLTLLHQAVSKTEEDTVALLIAQGADVNAKDNEGKTPLHLVENKYLAQLLIAQGAELNAQDNQGRTPLHLALIHRENLAKLLIAKGAELNTQDQESNTPLHLALIRRIEDLAELLIVKGSNPNAKDNEGKTPLHLVRNKDLAELLIVKGANPNAKDNQGRTPLHLVRNKGLAEFLIVKGSNPNAKDNQGRIPLHLVRNKYLAELLIAHGAELNAQDNQGSTPLHQALIRRIQDVYTQDNQSSSPSRQAPVGTIPDITELLIVKGADPNVKDNSGTTPLYLAIYYDRVAKRLIARRVDVNAKNNQGGTQRSSEGEPGLFELIESHRETR
ncbi:MAG: protein kinase [Symploca sp. SIO1A3]|nr:protein kinase [Symploca sp. SIO1A3]